MTDQDKLNADVQALTDAATAIETEIANLKNQPGAQGLDFTGLDKVVARLQGDESPAPTPTPTPPAGT